MKIDLLSVSGSAIKTLFCRLIRAHFDRDRSTAKTLIKEIATMMAKSNIPPNNVSDMITVMVKSGEVQDFIQNEIPDNRAVVTTDFIKYAKMHYVKDMVRIMAPVSDDLEKEAIKNIAEKAYGHVTSYIEGACRHTTTEPKEVIIELIKMLR